MRPTHTAREIQLLPRLFPALAATAMLLFASLAVADRSDVHLRAQHHEDQDLFVGGQDGYHSYRIPALVRTTSGRLIAFAEGRVASMEDYGNIDVVYKTSDDDGATWSGLGVIAGQAEPARARYLATTDIESDVYAPVDSDTPILYDVGDDPVIAPRESAGTWGNPTAVVDEVMERVWLFMSWNAATHAQDISHGVKHEGQLPIVVWGQRRMKMTWSDDDGETWARPVDLTQDLVPPSYSWDAVGPGVGIQTKLGPNAGRLIVPAIGRNLVSDDHGQTWTVQLLAKGAAAGWGHVDEETEGTSEGTILELESGALMRNDRAIGPVWGNFRRRMIAFGSVDLDAWSPFMPHDTLLDPKVQGSVLRYTGGSALNRILFLNSAHTANRRTMHIRLSYDEGLGWPTQRPLESTTVVAPRLIGGYSSLAKTADFQIGVLVEVNDDEHAPKHGSYASHRSILFQKFNLPWILNGTPE